MDAVYTDRQHPFLCSKQCKIGKRKWHVRDKAVWREQNMTEKEKKRMRTRMRRQAEMKKQRRRKILYRTAVIGLVIGIAFMGRYLVSLQKQEKREAGQTAAHCYAESRGSDENVEVLESMPAGGTALDNRRILEDAEVENMLLQLAKENGDIAKIYTDRESYPEALLTALAFNLEMTEFVQGYLTADTKAAGGFTEEEKEQDFPLFLQWDSRWGYVPYGGSCVGLAGCGPTCISMVIFSLTGNETATPDALAGYGMRYGYYVAGVGTDWRFMTDAAQEYGLSVSQLGLDEAVMKQYLDLGYPLICSVGAGDFTRSGHFIVLYGYDEEGFMVNDPNSRERSGMRWDFDTLCRQIKNIWGYRRA